MAEPFKELIGPAAVGQLADELAAAWPPFDRAGFVSAVVAGLAPLELKARVRHVAGCLRARLPEGWSEAARVLVEALPPPLGSDAGVSGLFRLWPVLQVVEDHGADAPAVSLPALREMTRRFSAEFAIRPLLQRHPEAVLEVLEGWVEDPDVHVRRLVSEGTRPRLPWGARLVMPDRARVVALLDRLVDDPSPYVRRSVANHLGDLAKEDLAFALAVGRRWLGARAERLDVVRHGLRGPLKAGDPEALALVGTPVVPVRVEAISVTPASTTAGGVVELRARLVAEGAATLRADVVWQWPSARGGRSQKVLRAGERAVAAGEAWELRFRLSTRPVTTRVVRPGAHALVLRVLGQDVAQVGFVLEA